MYTVHPILMMLAAGVALLTAAAALWLQGRSVDSRCFAVLISIAVTLSLFSVVAWAATAFVRIAPLPVTWALIGMLALIFALKLYRELQASPADKHS